jgi:XTP/dITP diphosphohydrolase
MLNKKIKKLFIGTNNKGKLKEIRDLLPKNIKLLSTLDFKLNSPKENGKTFQQNSLIKSRYFSKKTNLVCLADDSGLEIDILNKKPGIYSARWGGKKSDFKKAIKRVYKELFKKDKNWKNKKIKARFICALSICYLNKKIACVIGKVEGSISKKPKGKNGFGYDPIFVPIMKNMTFGEMKPSQKYKIDHRFKAFKKIKKFL